MHQEQGLCPRQEEPGEEETPIVTGSQAGVHKHQAQVPVSSYGHEGAQGEAAGSVDLGSLVCKRY